MAPSMSEVRDMPRTADNQVACSWHSGTDPQVANVTTLPVSMGELQVRGRRAAVGKCAGQPLIRALVPESARDGRRKKVLGGQTLKPIPRPKSVAHGENC